MKSKVEVSGFLILHVCPCGNIYEEFPYARYFGAHSPFFVFPISALKVCGKCGTEVGKFKLQTGRVETTVTGHLWWREETFKYINVGPLNRAWEGRTIPDNTAGSIKTYSPLPNAVLDELVNRARTTETDVKETLAHVRLYQPKADPEFPPPSINSMRADADKARPCRFGIWITWYDGTGKWVVDEDSSIRWSDSWEVVRARAVAVRDQSKNIDASPLPIPRSIEKGLRISAKFNPVWDHATDRPLHGRDSETPQPFTRRKMEPTIELDEEAVACHHISDGGTKSSRLP